MVLFLVLGCGALSVLGVVLVVMGGGLVAFFGLGLFTEQVETELRDNPVIIEHLGDLESCELDFWASGLAPGDDDFVFTVIGSKGRGRVTATCITVDADSEEIVAGTLRLSTGETIDLVPDDLASDDGELSQ